MKWNAPLFLLIVGGLQLHGAWLNETGTPAEADYAVVQFPPTLTTTETVSTPIFGRLYELGVTEPFGPSPAVTAQVGFGPVGTDPRTNTSWVWFTATYNDQVGSDDEYQGTLTFVASGTYSYTYRFSFDSGANWTAADLNGAGSNGGLDFSPANLGTATVNLPVPPVVHVGWLNETGLPGEADYAALQFPSAITTSNAVSIPIFGRIFEAGVTESGGPHPSVTAQVGYGPVGTDPRTNTAWVWFPAAYNNQFGSDDEYQGTVTFAASGTFSYTFRFTFQSDTNWTAADLNGAGSNVSQDFSPANLGTANVNLTVLGDFNHDGRVDSTELALVLSNYWRGNPMMIQSFTGPPTNCLHFALTNLAPFNLDVLATTNVALPLHQWQSIGPATLHYQITDPALSNHATRFYLPRWP